jgi:hypothetical protein
MSLLDTASLIVTPNAGKEGKLYSVVPSSGAGDFTVTRATTATRVNSEGLIELVPYNLFRYSEQFDNGAWVKTNATITTNATIAPNGTLTADKAIATNTASATRAVYQSFTPILNSTYNISVYVKAAEYTKFTISEIGNGRFGASFNLVAETSTSLGGLNYVSSLITNEGNGWYKCSIVATGSAVGWAVGFMGYPDGATPSSSGVSYAGNGVSGIFIWGAQLVEGSTPKDYLPTTTRLDIPRLDYSLGSCPNLLLEPQRTNLALRSQEFDNASWGKTNITVTENSIIAPNGTLTADKIENNAIVGNHFVRQTSTVASLQVYTLSVYLKEGTKNIITIADGFNTNELGTYNLTTQTATNRSGTNASIISVGNGWYRCSVTYTPTSTSLGFMLFSGSVYAGTDTIGNFYAWGAQLEAGAYPTSYIPTTSASVTRNSDQISLSNVYTNNLITASGGTWFVELRNNIERTRDTFGFIGIWKSSDRTNSLGLYTPFNGRLVVAKYISSSITPLFSTSTDTIKVAIKWNGATADVFVNGVKVVNATAFPLVDMGSTGTGGAVPLNINQMAIFPTPLTDTQCIELTTL